MTRKYFIKQLKASEWKKINCKLLIQCAHFITNSTDFICLIKFVENISIYIIKRLIKKVDHFFLNLLHDFMHYSGNLPAHYLIGQFITFTKALKIVINLIKLIYKYNKIISNYIVILIKKLIVV